MFDQQAFFRSLKQHDITVADLAKSLEINRTTLYRKISGESDFTRNEVQKCRELLGIEDCNAIFFAPDVT